MSLLLSQDPTVFNLGQLRHLWRGLERNVPCTCGSPLGSCEVYGHVGAPVQDGMKLQKQARSFVSHTSRLADWSDDATRKRIAMRHSGFLVALKKTLDRIADASGATTFVDTSKISEIALAFDLLPDVELYVLNLIRDPRAVACSWYKKNGSLIATARQARDWYKRQRRLDGWSSGLGPRYLAVRYEELAQSPPGETELIARWCGLPMPDSLFTGPDRAVFDWSRQHLYPPANERVLAEKISDVTIKPADSWRDPANQKIHKLASVLAGSFGKRYYP